MEYSSTIRHAVAIDIISVGVAKENFAPHYRYTDITPASRKYMSSLYPPTSPKIHELLERSTT